MKMTIAPVADLALVMAMPRVGLSGSPRSCIGAPTCHVARLVGQSARTAGAARGHFYEKEPKG